MLSADYRPFTKLNGDNQTHTLKSDELLAINGKNDTLYTGQSNLQTVELLEPSCNATIKVELNKLDYSIHINTMAYNPDSVIEFTDTAFENLTFTKDFDDLCIGNGTKSIRFINWFGENGYADGVKYAKADDIDTIKDSNGNVYKLSELEAVQNLYTVNATDGANIIKVMGNNKNIDALAGNDALLVYGTANTVSGGAGDDRIFINGKDATASGGAGNDTIYLTPCSSNAKIQFAKTDGDDILYSGGTSYGGSDAVLKFTDTARSDLTFTKDGDNLKIGTGEGNGTVTLSDWFNSDNVINTIQDSTGADFTLTDVLASYGLNRLSDGDDIFKTGYESNDNMTIIGGRGDDKLTIGGQNNTVIFATGDGNDTVTATNNTNTLKFTDVTKKDMKVSADGNNLKLSYSDKDSVTLTDWFSSSTTSINKVVDSADVSLATDLDKLKSDVAAWMTNHMLRLVLQ